MTENTNFSRRALLRTAGAAAIAASLPRAPSLAQPIPSSVTLPGRPDLLIRGGAVITVDPKLGVLEKADVHVRSGEIVAVGPTLDAPGAEIIDASDMIVMPGFVDTHWHMWGSIGRTFVTDARPYMRTKNATSPFYTPSDFYHSVSLGLAESIHAGIT